jgi:hypothetical protein
MKCPASEMSEAGLCCRGGRRWLTASPHYDQALFGRLQTWRGQPFTDARPNFGPPGSLEQFITQTAWPKQFGFFTQTLRFVGETLLYEVILLEMAASLLHRAAPFPSEAGAQTGVLESPIEAPAVMW